MNQIDSLWEQASQLRDEGNYDSALEVYNSVFSLISSKDFPLEYGMNHYYRGKTYGEIASSDMGNASSHLQNSIYAYDYSLKFITEEEYPAEYFRVHYGLGDAYLKLYASRGDVSDLDTSIDYYETALSYYSIAVDPIYFASINNKLGNAWRKKGNIEK